MFLFWYETYELGHEELYFRITLTRAQKKQGKGRRSVLLLEERSLSTYQPKEAFEARGASHL